MLLVIHSVCGWLGRWMGVGGWQCVGGCCGWVVRNQHTGCKTKHPWISMRSRIQLEECYVLYIYIYTYTCYLHIIYYTLRHVGIALVHCGHHSPKGVLDFPEHLGQWPRRPRNGGPNKKPQVAGLLLQKDTRTRTRDLWKQACESRSTYQAGSWTSSHKEEEQRF